MTIIVFVLETLQTLLFRSACVPVHLYIYVCRALFFEATLMVHGPGVSFHMSSAKTRTNFLHSIQRTDFFLGGRNKKDLN